MGVILDFWRMMEMHLIIHEVDMLNIGIWNLVKVL
jgi:hypothetical protein